MGNFMKGYQDNPRLSHWDQQRADKQKLIPIVKEALRLNMWLFNKYNNAWYTPEEFGLKYQNTELSNYEMARMLENIVIRDPRTGNSAYHKEIEKRIEAFHKEINELRTKGEAFLHKVVTYYQQKREN
jgi:hypothetical protein